MDELHDQDFVLGQDGTEGTHDAVEGQGFNEGPIPYLGFDKTHDLEEAEGFPDGGPADSELEGEVPFRRQAVPGLEVALIDEIDELADDISL